jgi:hypothetical protein
MKALTLAAAFALALPGFALAQTGNPFAGRLRLRARS